LLQSKSSPTTCRRPAKDARHGVETGWQVGKRPEREEVSDADWHNLIQEFVARRIAEATFHDRFFELWRASSQSGHANLPRPIETLFFVVEAYCPDPSLRDPGSAYEADGVELRRAAETALANLARPSHCSRLMTFLSRMKP